MANHEQPSERAAVEARVLEEAERVVTRLEQALAAAPEDPQLREQLERIVAQARHLRQRVADAIAGARARKDAGERGNIAPPITEENHA